jgi:hypothetical protein
MIADRHHSPPLDPARADRTAVGCVAVVCAPDGVRLVEVGPTRDAVLARLVSYVRRYAPNQLWPADARRVHRLLARGLLDAAVRHYFDAPARWDEEWLWWSPADP